MGAEQKPPERTSSLDVIKRLEADGWELVRVRGEQHQFRHPGKPGTVTLPHPRHDMVMATLKSIGVQGGGDPGQWSGVPEAQV